MAKTVLFKSCEHRKASIDKKKEPQNRRTSRKSEIVILHRKRKKKQRENERDGKREKNREKRI
jgi:hypothetical protein